MTKEKEKHKKIKTDLTDWGRQIMVREIFKQRPDNRRDLSLLKRDLARRYGLSIISNAEVLHEYKEMLAKQELNEDVEMERVLRKRAIRTMSGIAPVAVLTKPYKCPGNCAFCPTEKDVPQSYLSNEPAVMRAQRCAFHPYIQVLFRLKALEDNGHHPTKIELIVIGGTWSYFPKKYKFWYIWQCFKACNDYYSLKKKNKLNDFEDFKHKIGLDEKMEEAFEVDELEEMLIVEQEKNEKAEYNLIGLTLETRPDYINEDELVEMRILGCTRVELGVQAIDDEILNLNQRGHGIVEVRQASGLLKNYGFKTTYHIMPGLPGSNPDYDLEMYNKLWQDEDFQPDQLKFYPTVVTTGSLIYDWWKSGSYKPYTSEQLADLIIKCKAITPPYVRIIRLIRDIPGESIVAGNTITNLRQIMKDRGALCQCIRCREAKDAKVKSEDLELKIYKYKSSGGHEYFISFESKKEHQGVKTLYGFCRLRLASKRVKHKFKILDGSALIRELHIYGELVSRGEQAKVQHAGLGKLLLRRAERIAKEKGYKKIAIISGVGVRRYYAKLGYKNKDSYMIKRFLF